MHTKCLDGTVITRADQSFDQKNHQRTYLEMETE